MPKRSNDFQKLIHHIQTQISQNSFVEESRFLTDAITGQSREVDIVIEGTAASYSFIVSIEVIGWSKKKGDIEWVERMICKHSTLPTDKLILVSKTGFTKSAIKKAAFHRIETITIEQALSNAWKEFFKSLGRFEEITNRFRCRAIFKNKKKGSTNPILPLNQLVFADANLSERMKLVDIINIILQNQQLRDTIFNHIQRDSSQNYTVDFKPPKSIYVLDENNKTNEISLLRIELESSQKTSHFKLEIGSFKGREIAFGRSIFPKDDKYITLVNQSDPNTTLVSGVIEDEQGKRQLIGKIE